MTWLKKDDRFSEHRKIRRLSDGAYRLHDTALVACARDETDGMITEADVDEMTHGKRLRKYIPDLVAADLWEVVPGGWMIHDFLHYNPSHAKSEAVRAANRERQERKRNRDPLPDPDTTPSQDDLSRRDSRVTPRAVTPLVTPPRPVPSRPVPKDSPQTQVANARAAVESAKSAAPGEGWLGDALGLVN